MAFDGFGYSNPFSGSRWNTATGERIYDEPSGETNPRREDLMGKNIDPYSRNVTDFSTEDFDPSDHNQVLALQKSLGLKEDAIFGPKTEEAYRSMVNTRRENQGLDAYTYDDPMYPSQDSGEYNSWGVQPGDLRPDAYGNINRDLFTNASNIQNQQYQNEQYQPGATSPANAPVGSLQYKIDQQGQNQYDDNTEQQGRRRPFKNLMEWFRG